MSKKKTGANQQGAPMAERVAPLKTYKLYIGGQFPRTESGRYYPLYGSKKKPVASVCLSSVKDVRNAVSAARTAQSGWAGTAASLRGQILYRIAEMMEGRKEQFIDEQVREGGTRARAGKEIDLAVDRVVYYAGWADKVQQVFSSVNPVAGPFFNFSMLEPTGVVGLAAPEPSGLLGLITHLAPTIVCGNTSVVLASQTHPLSAMTFAEVLETSDVPGGVVNILTGDREELLQPLASHMDVNALVVCGCDKPQVRRVQEAAADNVKRVLIRDNDPGQNPYLVLDGMEVKTTWHPVGV